MGLTKKVILLACSVFAVVLVIQCLRREQAIRGFSKIEVSQRTDHWERASTAVQARAADSMSSVSAPAIKRTSTRSDDVHKRKLERQAIKYQLQRTYGGYLSLAGLGDVQRDLFLDLLEEQGELAGKIVAVSPGANPWADFDDQGGYSGGPLSSIEQDIRKLLGAEKYKEFCIYRFEIVVREGLKVLESRLSYTKEPLQPDQLSALVSSAWSVGIFEYVSRLSSGENMPEAALDEAQKVLSPAQYLAFLRILDDNRRVSTLRKK